jgi:hypothetical protein
MDVILGALLRERFRESNHGQLGGGVVGLAEAAKETSGGGRVDNTAKLLFPEVRPRRSGALVRAADVHGHDEIPVLVLHVLEGDIAEDACVVQEYIDAAEVLDGGFNDLVAILNAVVVGYGLSSGGLDLLDDNICGLL